MKVFTFAVLFLIACSPVVGQLVRVADGEGSHKVRIVRPPNTSTSPASVPDLPIAAPTNGVPIYWLRHYSPSSQVTVRVTTWPDAPWTDSTWLSQQRTDAAGQLSVLVLHERGPLDCSVATITVPPAANQVVDRQLDVSGFGTDDSLAFEAWPRGYKVEVFAPDGKLIVASNPVLVPEPGQTNKFAPITRNHFPQQGTCPN